MSKNLFITGTGTDVGKTYVTGLIVKKLREGGASSAYYKAAMSGNERRTDGTLIPGDALQVKTMSGVEQPLEEMCPYIYETAVSPHLAAKIEGNPIEMECVLKNFDRAAHMITLQRKVQAGSSARSALTSRRSSLRILLKPAVWPA